MSKSLPLNLLPVMSMNESPQNTHLIQQRCIYLDFAVNKRVLVLPKILLVPAGVLIRGIRRSVPMDALVLSYY